MKNSKKIILFTLFFVIAYFLIDQLEFEMHLNKLQYFCENLELASSFDDVVNKSKAINNIAMNALRDGGKVKFSSIYLDDLAAAGWTCSLEFKENQLTKRDFGSDHGARKSYLGR